MKLLPLVSITKKYGHSFEICAIFTFQVFPVSELSCLRRFNNKISMHCRRFCKRVVPKNFAKSTGKHLCQSLFLIKLKAAPATLLKTRLWHRCCPVNFAKF